MIRNITRQRVSDSIPELARQEDNARQRGIQMRHIRQKEQKQE
jgi:hypothetical protein